MATISSFESLKNPSRTDLKQFTELLEPLFRASSDDARREAAAVLSQCKVMPQAVALFIASQPIHVAALFLTRSPAIDDQTLMVIARTQGGSHAKAIAKREDLSPQVIDFLVGLRETTKPEAKPDAKTRSLTQQKFEPFGPLPPVPELPKLNLETIQRDIDRIEREEELRQRLRFLVRDLEPVSAHPPVLSAIEATQEALLVRFARAGEARHFLHVLAHALSCGDSLAERILQDTSGTQLATTLVALGLRSHEIEFTLCQFYPHLKQPQDDTNRADQMIANLDIEHCKLRVSAWQRADFYTRYPQEAEEAVPEAANDGAVSGTAPKQGHRG